MKSRVMTLMLVLSLALVAGPAGAAVIGDPDAVCNGKMGIGTSTLHQNLNIYNPAAAAAGVMFQNATTGANWNDGFNFNVDSAGHATLRNFENTDMYFSTGGAVRMVIKNDGKIGMGITTPWNKLGLYNSGATATGIQFQNGTTGSAWNDGFVFNCDSAGNGTLLNYENKDTYLATNGLVRMAVKADGKVGIGTTSPTKALDVAGEAKCTVLNITGGSDLCEHFDVASAPGAEKTPVEPATVVCIDPNKAGDLIVSAKAYDRTVAGIISGAGGLQPGVMMGQDKAMRGDHPVALTGRVYCKADATQAPIVPGDLLTTSDTPGHAMKVTDHSKAPGAIIGKAMTPLADGKGLVLVLVTLQ